MTVTDRMEDALVWLQRHGGSGVIDRHGYIVAHGEQSKAFAAETWLRLVAGGFVAGAAGRMIMTGAGDDHLASVGRSTL